MLDRRLIRRRGISFPPEPFEGFSAPDVTLGPRRSESDSLVGVRKGGFVVRGGRAQNRKGAVAPQDERFGLIKGGTDQYLCVG